MANQTLIPDAIVSSTGFTDTPANNLLKIDEGVTSPDGNWMTATGVNVDGTCTIDFPTPIPNLDTGAGTIVARVWAKKYNSNSGTPEIDVWVYDGVISKLGVTPVTSTSGQLFEVSFDAADLVSGDGSNLRVRVDTYGTGGNPASRNSVDIGAVEIVTTYTLVPPVITLNGNPITDHQINTTYTDADAEYFDYIDGTGVVTATGSVNTAVAGDYTLYYNHTNTNGDAATQVTRTVRVGWLGTTKSTVYTYPQTVTNVDDSVARDAPWANPDNVKAIDSAYAVSSTLLNTNSDWISATNFDFSIIPDLAGIEGVLVASREQIAGLWVSGRTSLELAGSLFGEEKSSPEPVTFPTTPIDDLLGGSTDTWKTGITASDVKSNTFGYRLQVTLSGASGGFVNLDAMRMLIYYHSFSYTDPTPDTTAPIITLTGDAIVNHTVGGAYTDAGATASDNKDGDITGSIVTTGVPDGLTRGEFTVAYNVTDAAGNPATEVTRTVRVGEIVVKNTGWKKPNTTSQSATGGGNAWTNDANIKLEDGVFATCSGSSSYSDYIYSNTYGHTFPTDAVVKGIEVGINVKSDAPANVRQTYIHPTNLTGVLAKSISTYDLTTELNKLVYGSPTDLWGTTAPPLSEFITNNFRIAQYFSFSGTATVSVDNVDTRIYYETFSWDTDTTVPTVGIDTLATATAGNETAYTITGTCSDTTPLTITVNGLTYPFSVEPTTGTWTITLDVSSIADGTGAIIVDASQTDAAGNIGNATQATADKDTTVGGAVIYLELVGQ